MSKILALSLLLVQSSYAFVPSMPALPGLPMFGDFNPNKLRAEFNQFVGVEPDFSREKRLVSEIEDAVLDGDVEYLPLKNSKEVFSIFMESEAGKVKGGVIILHNRGQHANWADAIKPLRTGLAVKGWDTLSVQMPVLDKHAKYYDYVPIFPYSHQRIDAAIDFYQQKGIDNVVIIAHGCGVHMAMSYIDKYGDGKLKAFVGIGMGATDYRQKLINDYPLYKMKVPILDIYAQQDFHGVLQMAGHRKMLMEIGGNKKSKQIVVKDAGHYYQNEAAERLVDKVSGWLNVL
ncbi:MAG: DUF3530 family protein [Candidatus Thioglobus sp.]|nr:MAG: DUF3530 family protein [Candidatus Thioglobus sp.]